jgi:hypothetical protein
MVLNKLHQKHQLKNKKCLADGEPKTLAGEIRQLDIENLCPLFSDTVVCAL